MNSAELSTTALLEAHGDWVRRLARSLVGDAAAADDIAQDTWEATLRRGPRHATALRAWLGRIVTNRARNEARGGSRRRSRETRLALEVLPATAPSPEDLAGTVELQQRLAASVSALDEQHRRVVYLRYFEGLDSREIAQRLGVPAGTVRWRLKNALEQIRQQLDSGPESERQRWRALLLPLAAPPISWGPSAAGITWWRRPAVALAMATMTAALLVLVLFAVSALRPAADRAAPLASERASSSTSGGPAAPPPRTPAAPPRFAAAVPLVALGPEECPALSELRATADLRRRELETYDDASAIFARSAPNAVAQRHFGAAYEAGMSRVGKCEHNTECRGLVCKVQLLVPAGLRPWDCFPGGRETWPEGHLDRRQPTSIGNQTPIADPVSKRSFARHDLHYRLASVTGEALPADRRVLPPPVTPGLGKLRVLPGALSDRCQAQGQRLLSEITQLETRISRVLMAARAFEASEPNRAAKQDVSKEIARILTLEGKTLPFQVECRTLICSVTPTAALDPAMAIDWECKSAPGQPQLCMPRRNESSWWARLDSGMRDSAILGQGFPPHRRGGQDMPAYVRVQPLADRHRTSPRQYMCQVWQLVRDAGVLEKCEARHGGESGEVEVKASFPGPDDPLVEGRRRATVDIGGELGSSALGRCVGDSLGALLDQQEVPELRGAMVSYKKLKFPGIASLWSQPSPCDQSRR